jgi:peptidyl-prolyl cis-trans isomerase SurA
MMFKEISMLRLILVTVLATAIAPVATAAETAAAAAVTATPAVVAPTGVLLDKVVAIVNEGVVTESELNEQIETIAARLREQKTALPVAAVLRQQVLDRLIVQEVQFQRAEKIGLKITDEQLNSALGEIAQRNSMSLAQLPDALAAQGIEYAGYRDNMRKEITLQALRQRDVLGRINITPRELDQFIERLKKLPSASDEYNISHILLALPQDASQAQLEEITKRAQEIHDRATTGAEDFGRLAVAYSSSQTALEGGSLGWRKGPELPTFLAEVIVSLKPGDVSKPLLTPSGYHLVKLNSIRSINGSRVQDQAHARHILLKLNELEDDGTVKLKLAGIRERILKGEDFAAFASSMSQDPGSSVDGGDLGWTGPDTFVPEFASVLGQLAENEVSEPFRTKFGWHIVQLLGRRQFDTTEEQLRQTAFEQLRESKADEETELWLRKLRDEAFIDTEV